MFDNHVHCHEFPREELEGYTREWTLVCVSDDLATSKRTAELRGAVRCVGIHPWQVDKAEPGDLEAVVRLAEKAEVPCVGEVGLDRRFVPQTFDKQREFFRAFLRLARELDLVVNVHAPDAWADVVEELRRADVDRALIHWYTGPLDLLETIRDLGYYISINPAVVIQKKHQEVAKVADRRIVLLESDGPYEYRGMRLAPPLINKTVEKLAELWESPRDQVVETVESNARRLWRL
ncbi:TatD family hydrolase [Pyrobaculum neutrophilum]|uniref:TatD-related deoxyribonuclease n=1 Tax=Pyrobaculum neutrophilum (strain DSM 2338 / JCM 9278 / NBRC 100436 / V24Sta) TaxID=444157 RepID=B1Y8Z3_PYRNV|nr:TatD family hydrolase [Pyrobaculum neutrophilum]ACB40222.1 TatD-related deoxyribonuclease [Pyrobaculum neutrophilum V24Sta]